MKYTRSESGAVVEVHGCAKCPYMTKGFGENAGFMFCEKHVPGANGKLVKRHKKLTSHWTGPYHASCPLPSEARNVPPAEVKK